MHPCIFNLSHMCFCLSITDFSLDFVHLVWFLYGMGLKVSQLSDCSLYKAVHVEVHPINPLSWDMHRLFICRNYVQEGISKTDGVCL